MTKIQLMRRAVKLWPGNRYNQRAWVRAVELLGDRWLLAVRVQRRSEQ